MHLLKQQIKKMAFIIIQYSCPQLTVSLIYSTLQLIHSGHLLFNLNPYYEGKEIIIRLKDKAYATIVLDSKATINQPFAHLQEQYDLQSVRDYLARSLKINQVQRYYSKRVDT